MMRKLVGENYGRLNRRAVLNSREKEKAEVDKE